MHTLHKIKKTITIVTLLLIVLVSLSPLTSAEVTINADDGIWSEDFLYESLDDAEENLLFKNSAINHENGVVSLSLDSRPRVYNFAETDFLHKASVYRSWKLPTGLIGSLFNTPDNPRFSEFNNREYNAIKAKNNNLLVTRQSVGIINRQVIQEYRFQLDVGRSLIGDINIYWKGAAENSVDISLYLWQFGQQELAAKWVKLDSTENSTESIVLSETINAENASLAIMENNYFYIRVVATAPPRILQTCSLSVDYVELISKSEQSYYSGPGFVTTKKPISPPQKNFYWETIAWNDFQLENTEIRYQVMYDPKGKGNVEDFEPIPDQYFSDSNKNGFTKSPVYLHKIPTSGLNAITNIYLKANLTSQKPAQSPLLYNWAVTWQTNPKQWTDSFNSSYRIESRTNININKGYTNISSLIGEWPMTGFNPQNTRATDVKGPQSNYPTLQWYSSMDKSVGGGFSNPVIGEGFIYAFSHDGKLLKYDMQATNSNSPDSIELVAIEYYNSPVITEDFVIVASGHSKKGGSTLNAIIGINKDFSSQWKFDYEEPISYYASPVVYDNVLYITSWTGDTKLFSDLETNKVIAIDLDKVPSAGKFTRENDAFLWEYDLPAGSYSTPAIYNDMVFVACKSTILSDDTFFALDAKGNADGTTDLLWSADVGSVDHSSPVVYDDTVFITSKQSGRLIITALDIDPQSDSRILWEKQLYSFKFLLPSQISRERSKAESTPAVFNDVLYISTPRGDIIALHTKTGEQLWKNQVYNNNKLLINDMTSSPVYANGYIYVGTPAGKIIALDANDNGSLLWQRDTFENEYFIPSPIYSSPAISNGMLFISDEDGVLYALGEYEQINREMNGQFTSIPINLPTGTWWGTFHSEFTKAEGSTVEFSILDENKTFLRNISKGQPLTFGAIPHLRTIYLKAELYSENLTVNPRIDSWQITFVTDNQKPEFVENSFKPNPKGWLNTTTPQFSIEVWDNQTGLLLDTTQYTLKYIGKENNDTLQHKATPEYTGENGVNHSVLSVDVSTLPFAQNISRLVSLQITINDIATNENSIFFNLKQDITKPVSQISKETNGSQFNTESVLINATAHDPGDTTSASGVIRVKLYYRHSVTSTFSGNWIYYDDSNKTKPSWEFINEKGSGYYQLCTIAIDDVGNVEDFPELADTTFIIDNTAPKKPIYSGEHWFNDLPSIPLEFSDDFLLDTIRYKPNFDTSEWIIIDSDINKKTYNEAFELKQEFWDMMDSEKQYVLLFWINDTLGNERIITEDQGYKLFKDKNKPIVDVTIPSTTITWTAEDTLLIEAFAYDGEGSGIQSIELFYRYSENSTFTGEWISYGILTSEPFEWEFETIEGDGYYEFKIVAQDAAGNVAESDVVSTGLTQFPTILIAAMIGLISAVIIVGVVVIIKWRKE
jgi:outer membrane protein assembly factor BamB